MPKFKYSTNNGRQELKRGILGSGGKLMYYEAVAAFVKLAYENRSVQVLLLQNGPEPVKLVLCQEDMLMDVTMGAAFSVRDVQALAVFNKNVTTFNGVMQMNKVQFLRGVAKARLWRHSLASS